MSTHDLPRRLAAEALGTMLLVATVVGAGIMAQKLTQDAALQLLANALPTGAMLVVLITIFAPISGAHFNPAVSLVMTLRGDLPGNHLAPYFIAQISGAIAGTMLAHLMFEQALVSFYATPRTGASQWLAEMTAAAGLVLVILGTSRARPDAIAWNVGLYIVAAYWFTASTSFANPAVTIGRGLTGSFAGIRLIDLPGFIIAQMLGALIAGAFARWIFAAGKTQAPD